MKAYGKQGISLEEVQRNAPLFERIIKETVDGKSGRIKYTDHPRALLQMDIVLPSSKTPKTAISVTHSNPDTPGHSNENKFQLKLGEIYLLKTYHEDLRCLITIGGSEKAWLPYVLPAFKQFYDGFLIWEEGKERELREMLSCGLRNEEFWEAERQRRREIVLSKDPQCAPISSLRNDFLMHVIPSGFRKSHPEEIPNELLRSMALKSYEAYIRTRGESGKFWIHLINANLSGVQQERNFFNPTETTVEILLDRARFRYEGQLGFDMELANLLHDFGMIETSVGEDFVLYSRKENKPVYIQCKSSGGGPKQHAKNIGNRSKEQIGRSMLYRCRYLNDKIVSIPQNFIWIGVLDGNWRMPNNYPLKHIHFLEIAGYTKHFAADTLVTSRFEPNLENSLLRYLDDLQCYKQNEISDEEWRGLMNRCGARKKVISRENDDRPGELEKF